MAISSYLREIGRGAKGARPLTRDQSCDLLGQILDDRCSDLEIGAFCIAMRIKGETAEEMAGFLDAIAARMALVPASSRPVVVLPSYNGARKLPVLTPLLALLLARHGLPVLLHGTQTEDQRVASGEVLKRLGVTPGNPSGPIAPGELRWIPTENLLPGLKRLLEVRRHTGLRNSAHSLVKLMNPCAGPSLVVGNYTHPEYADSMAATFKLTNTRAFLMRGTEGEPVADPRRIPRMELFQDGHMRCLQEAQNGPVGQIPDLPSHDAEATAAFTLNVLEGRSAAPHPLVLQVKHIVQACEQANLAMDHEQSEPSF